MVLGCSHKSVQFVPPSKSYKLVDVVQASNKNRAIEIAEYNYKNPDEKVESELLSTSDNVADAAILIIIAFVVIMVMLN